MGRLLSVEDFGTLNSLLSLMIVLTVPTNALLLLIAKYTAEYNSSGIIGNLSAFLRKSFRKIGIISIIFIISTLGTSSMIKNYVRIDNLSLIIIIILIAGITLLTTVPLGALQGLKKFYGLGLINLLGTTVKFFAALLLVFMGFNLYGGLIGVLLGNLVMLLIGFFITKTYFSNTDTVSLSLSTFDVAKFFLPLLITNLCISLFTSIDTLIVKHYFSPEITGLYSSAALFGKAMFFSTSAIVTVLFPTIIHNKNNFLSSINTLKRALLYTCLLCTICIAALYWLSPVIVKILFGMKYIDAVHYIRLVMIMMVPFCLINIIISYNLALGNIKTISFSLVIGCILGYYLLVFFHQTVNEIIYIIMAIGMAILAINLFNIFALKHKLKDIK